MDGDLLKICYESELGGKDIRTIKQGDILYVSLPDIIFAINDDNLQLQDENPKSALMSLVRGQMDIIEDDEMRFFEINGDKQVFVTEPGLYRVMASNRSKAAIKFQRWLFHDVIPSIVKYGEYPAPSSHLPDKSSNLSQMAELLATNSRLLADTISKQEKLASEVSIVKNSLGTLGNRIDAMEGRGGADGFHSVKGYLAENGHTLMNEVDVHAWCENISFKDDSPYLKDFSGDRMLTKYPEETIRKAIEFVIACED